jgi:ribosomal protein S18 acetylase RimI-like enzyme
LRIIPLSAEWESHFWKYVNQDPLDYYFFIFDWKYKKAQSQIFLAIGELDEISGLMLVYNKHIIQIRGNPKSTKLLLDSLKEKTIELSAPLDCKGIILQKFPSPKLLQEITLMQLQKGVENIQITEKPQNLDFKDAEVIAALMRISNPDYWADFTSETLEAIFSETIWVGIKDKQTLASIGVATSIEGVSHIMFIATDKKYQNKGYATSIVSTLVMQFLKKYPTAIIHVMSNNKPAIKVYSKVGFSSYQSYLFLRT